MSLNKGTISKGEEGKGGKGKDGEGKGREEEGGRRSSCNSFPFTPISFVCKRDVWTENKKRLLSQQPFVFSKTQKQKFLVFDMVHCVIFNLHFS